MNLSWYERAYEKHGATPAGMGYNGADQVRQYLVARKFIGDDGGVIADLGGGWGVGRACFPLLVVCDRNRSYLPPDRSVCGDERCIRSCDWMLLLGIFSVGYEWAEVVAVLRRAFAVSRKGIVVAFVPSPVTDLKMSVFPWDDWKIQLAYLDPHFTLATGWDRHLVAACCRKIGDR